MEYVVYIHQGKQMTVIIKKKKKNYLNNADMLLELIKCHDRDRLTEEMGKMFISLVKRYASIPRFSGYTYNEDMQSFALLTLSKVWRGFDATKYKNPFAYFTQIVHNAFHQFDNQERRQRDIRDAVLVEHGKNPSFSYSDRMSESHDSHSSDDLGDNDYMEQRDNEANDDVLDMDATLEGESLLDNSVTAQAGVSGVN